MSWTMRRRRVKILSPIAIATAEGACGSSAVGPFRRLTARLRGPKLCLSPHPHRVRHELRSPALATPARHPGSERRPGRRIAPSLHARGVGRQGRMAEPVVMPGTGSVCARQEKAPPILPFITPKKSTQRPRVCRRDAPSIDERLCHRIRPGDDVFGTHNGQNTQPNCNYHCGRGLRLPRRRPVQALDSPSSRPEAMLVAAVAAGPP